MLRKLLFLSFIEGAAVMAAELCGAKLLAPIFGSSLFVWASVMGITLAALAGGYFFGGWQTSRSTNFQKSLFQILAAAALCILLMPVISFYLVPRISYLPFLGGVVFSCLSVLFLPVFFLGAASPLFIVMQTNLPKDAGKVSGTVYAISTAGGIVATFICGFYLIPVWGLNECLLFFGSLLLVCNFIVLKKFSLPQVFIFIGFFYLNWQIHVTPKNTIYASDSILGHLEVQDLYNGEDTVRSLKINDIIQSEMNLKSHLSVSEYIHLLDSLIPTRSVKGSALVLGLGAGLTANNLVKKNYVTEGVEFDQRIIKAAENYFFLDKNILTFYSDARFFLNATQKKYDVVLADLFKAEEQPSHVLTLESLLSLKKNLNDSALVFVTWHGFIENEKGRGTVILFNTFKEAGFEIKLCSKSIDERYRNIVFVAALHSLPQLPFELHEELAATDLINTDNAPRLEKYNAEANKAWRAEYLHYYQNRPN